MSTPFDIEVCAICRDNLSTTETRTLGCNHVFHTECINSWLVRVPSCPYCRQSCLSIIDLSNEWLCSLSVSGWINISQHENLSIENMTVFMEEIARFDSEDDDVYQVIRNFIIHQYISEDFLAEYSPEIFYINDFSEDIERYQPHIDPLFLIELATEEWMLYY